MIRSFLFAVVLSCFALAAHAQCTNGLITNCPTALQPQSSDWLLGYQQGQNPHTRKFSLTQVGSVALGGLYLPLTGGTISGALQVNGGFSLGSNAITIGGPVTTSGSFTTSGGSLTLTQTGPTNITLPTSGTVYSGHGLIGAQTFCASGCTATGGTYTPDAGTNSVIIEVQASGGGSGGCGSTGSGFACVSGSGASGSYAKGWFSSGFTGITMTPGAAGAAGASGTNAGGNGATASAGSLISCPGGGGGLGGAALNGITAGQLNANTAGTTGPAACTITPTSALLASVAGPSSGFAVVFGTTAGTQISGPVGSTPMGSGIVVFVTSLSTTTTTGHAGTGYGWGAGSSSNDASQSATAGLAGGPSIITVLEFN